MAWGLPKLPGLVFSDPTKTQYHIRSSLRYYQGHRFPDTLIRGPGGTATDVDSNAFALPDDSVNYDPSLTYGRVKQPALPPVIPHWVHYDKRCLNFTAFFKQTVYDNPDENYRVRVVNIVYFLEDDTMTVMEPRVKEEIYDGIHFIALLRKRFCWVGKQVVNVIRFTLVVCHGLLLLQWCDVGCDFKWNRCQ